MKHLKNIIKFTPFLMLLGDGVAILLANNLSSEQYKNYVSYHMDLIGHSLITGLFMLYFANRFKLCVYTKMTIYALLGYNIVNFIDSLVYLENYFIYMTITVLYGISCGFILIFRYAISTNGPDTARRKL